MIERFLKYIEFEKRYSKHTLISYTNDLETFNLYVDQEFSIKDLTLIEAMHIKSWLMSMVEAQLAEKSVNRKIATIKSFYKFLLKNNLIEVNPCDKIKTLKMPKKLPVFVQEKSMVQLLDQLEFENSFEGKRDKLIFEILYGTGIRLSEIINLKILDVNLNSKVLKVKGKGNKERIIPINQSLLTLIQEYLIIKNNEKNGNDSEYLIVTDSMKKTYPMFIFRIVKKYLNYVTTNEKRSPHTLRHTFATHLLNKGADLNAIKELLGHTSLAATQVYTHNSIDKLKNIFEKAHPKA